MKNLLIVCFALISFVVLSSSSCNDQPVNVKWAEGALEPLQVFKDTNDNYEFQFIKNESGDTGFVYTGEYGLLLDLAVERSIAQFRRPQLVKSAYAFTFSTHYVLQNNVDSIRIVTLRDFDQEHPKYSLMNDLILVQNGDIYSSIEQVIATSSELNYDEIYAYDNEGSRFRFSMRFTKDPVLDSLVEYVAYVYCSDNIEIIDSTRIISIRK